MSDFQQQRQARMWLTHVVEPGSPAMGEAVQRLGPMEVVDRLRAQSPQLPGVPTGTIAVLKKRMEGIEEKVRASHARYESLAVRFIAPGDLEWPTQLDDLGATRPLGLWVRGRANLRLWALQSVAVVGARASTQYGRSVTASLAGELGQRGWAIVSGAAYGIDAAAHQAALAASGRTVAVLACGVDVVYPLSHAQLLREIAHNGLVVSEFPSASRVYRSRFLQRNRVIAALTRATVVVEAAVRSGALNTANHAAALNRQVLAVPGSVHSAMSAGCHELIRTGVANLVSDTRDVLDLLAPLGECEQPQRRAAGFGNVPAAGADTKPGCNTELGTQTELGAYTRGDLTEGPSRQPAAVDTGLTVAHNSPSKASVFPTNSAGQPTPGQQPPELVNDLAVEQQATLRPEYAQVLAALGVRISRDLDDLALRTGISMPVLTAALGVLESQGRVSNVGLGWRRVPAAV